MIEMKGVVFYVKWEACGAHALDGTNFMELACCSDAAINKSFEILQFFFNINNSFTCHFLIQENRVRMLQCGTSVHHAHVTQNYPCALSGFEKSCRVTLYKGYVM